MPATDKSIREIRGLNRRALPRDLLRGGEPLVLRDLLGDWPLVRASRASPQHAIDHLRCYTRGARVANMPELSEIRSRLFYNSDMSGTDFRPERLQLSAVLNAVQQQLKGTDPATIYLGSSTVKTFFPRLETVHRVELGNRDSLYSLWIGNRMSIPAHQDVPDNLACVAAGRQRITLLPPDQLANLYIGPLDSTPAGQAVSLVDFTVPDLQRFPRFAQAMQHAQVTVLEPGDALYVPSMWWHHVETLDTFNVLLNYWWCQSPDKSTNALTPARQAACDLPLRERAA